jgi:hypothetical protein
MGGMIVRRETAVEYFKELVEYVLARQGLAASELTSFYVVQLLAGFLSHSSDDDSGQPLGLRLALALERDGLEQRATLKQIGDLSLFTSGFFSDSLRRKLVDLDYYMHIGGTAYSALSRQEADAFAPVFAELAGKFVQFVDVLCEVSERSACTSNSDLLRLYERWLKTGSLHSSQLLVERGVIPIAGAQGVRVQ